MGLFGAIVDAVSRGVAQLFNPMVAVGVAVMAAALFIVGAPLILIGVTVVIVLGILGVMSACNDCNKKVANALKGLQELFSAYGQFKDYLPNGAKVDTTASWYKVVGRTTYVHLEMMVEYPNPNIKKFSEIKNKIKETLETAIGEKNTVSVIGINVNDNDIVIPLGHVTFSGSDLRIFVMAKDKLVGRVVATKTKESYTVTAAALINFNIGACNTCKTLGGGKDANTLIDEHARRQGLGFVRRFVVWKFPKTRNGLPLETIDIALPGVVNVNNIVLNIYYGSPAFIAKMYEFCTSSRPKTETEKRLCETFPANKICPTGVVYLPDVFVGALMMAGYANNSVIAEAKAMATFLLTTTNPITVHVSDLPSKGISEQNVMLLYKGTDNGYHLTPIVRGTNVFPFGGSISAKDIAILYSTVPYSLYMRLSIREAAGTSFGKNRGEAEMLIDPYNISTQTMGLTIPRPKVVVKDAYGRLKILYIHGCVETIAEKDEENKKVILRGPVAAAMVDTIKQLIEYRREGIIAQINCKVFYDVVKALTDMDCFDNDGKIKKECSITAYGE